MTKLGNERVGDGQHRIVCLHGFTQSRTIWHDVARRLVSQLPDTQCLLVDLPGHGDSTTLSADLPTTARWVAELGGTATYVGYSLGGRVALHAAVNHPGVVERIVAVSSTAGIDDVGERELRAIADDRLAERIKHIGVDAFLDEWLAQPIFSDLPPTATQRAARSLNSADGLADSLRRCSQGRQQPLWRELEHLRIPLLAVAGSRDAKYVALARRLATTAPQGRLRILDGAGHSVVLHQPVELANEIAYWITNPNA